MRALFVPVAVFLTMMGFVALAYQDARTPPATAPADQAADAPATETYDARCATCHGSTMRGARGPSILVYVRYHTNKEVTAVLQGSAHPKLALSDAELKAVLRDIRVLAGTNPAMATGG